MEKQIDTVTCNWFGDICSRPLVKVKPANVDELVTIIKNEDDYPAPVRVVGSNSSVTRCGAADGGTMVDMSAMNRIIEINEETITVEAGAMYVDVVQELQKKDLQFNINIDYGNLAMGAAACAQTKDSSFPGESGQLCSYVVGVKVVTPDGEKVDISEDRPELLRAMRTSFGLLGIVYEVTFRIERIRPLAFYHETFSINEFIDNFSDLKARDEAMMYYVFPFQDSITVEFRQYQDSGKPTDHQAWMIRNLSQRNIGPGSSRLILRYVPNQTLQNFFIDGNLRLFQWLLNRLNSDSSVAADQVIRFPERAGAASFTFSLWAFPEESLQDVFPLYVDFCKDHYKNHGYRTGMPSVGFHVSQDNSSLLSFTKDGPVMTIDPVSSGGPGWSQFMDAYNEFGSRNGGIPLFNHTPQLSADHVEQAYGERFDTFRDFRQRYDPQNRFLNDYFAELL